jgi:monooxygenase
VKRASWSGADSRWTVEIVEGTTGTATTMTCSFLFMCGGYYNYDKGYLPDFPGHDSFTGRIVHPQHWPTDLDYHDKSVVVIGSGATAVTLVPAMVAEGAAKVTMLQRSPTYMAAGPSEDKIAIGLRKILPGKAAYVAVRWKNILLGSFFFNLARTKPAKMKAMLLKGIRKELGPDYDIDTNFTPTYNPWEQRLCLVPDSDMFAAIRSGKAEIVTAHIDRFTPTGIRLTSGQELPAEVIVTATGLNLQMLAGVEVTVDGASIDPAQCVLHKGIMLSGMPNLAMWFGYTNASWTLKADLTSEYMCRMLSYMDVHQLTTVTPIFGGSLRDTEEFVDFSSGYFQRAKHLLPKQGHGLPWKLNQNYLKDIKLLRKGRVDDEGLVFNGTGHGRSDQRQVEDTVPAF